MRILKREVLGSVADEGGACITTRSDEDTETDYDDLYNAIERLLASPPDPMRILKRGPKYRAKEKHHACITTRSDEDTETIWEPVQTQQPLSLHHHPIR